MYAKLSVWWVAQMGAPWWAFSVVRGRVWVVFCRQWRTIDEFGAWRRGGLVCSRKDEHSVMTDEGSYIIALHPDRRWDTHKSDISNVAQTAPCFRGRIDRTWLFTRYIYMRVGRERQEAMKNDPSVCSLSVWVASSTSSWDRQHGRWSRYIQEGNEFSMGFLLCSGIFPLVSHLSTVSKLWKFECGSPASNPAMGPLYFE